MDLSVLFSKQENTIQIFFSHRAFKVSSCRLYVKIIRSLEQQLRFFTYPRALSQS